MLYWLYAPHACTHTCTQSIYAYAPCTHVCMVADVWRMRYACMWTHVCMQTCTHMHTIHICICIHAQMYAYMYVDTCGAHVDTHMYTYMGMCPWYNAGGWHVTHARTHAHTHSMWVLHAYPLRTLQWWHNQFETSCNSFGVEQSYVNKMLCSEGYHQHLLSIAPGTSWLADQCANHY